MGSLSGDELSLLVSIQSSIPMEICDSTRKAKKIVNVKKLEEEMMKIHGFKLQIPLCLEILNHAISYMKEEENEKCSEIDTQPLLQDFISLNKTIEEEEEEDLLREELLKEKEFQLWRDNDHVSNIRFSDTKIKNKVENVRNDEKKRSNGLSMLLSPKVETGLGLGLTSSSMVNVKSKGDIVRCGYTSNTMPQPPQFLQQQALRKPRRCWTPELHRRFVDALKQLGGPGVATPKQIREHMQEEGLSNDEVKSHLQKYRLHIRKPSSKPEKQSVVVLGLNLWISSEQEQETCQGGEGESTKRRSDSRFGSPQGPLQQPCTTTTTCGDSNSIGSC